MSEVLVLLGTTLAASSGIPGLFLGRRTPAGQWLATLLTVAAAGFGLSGVGVFWAWGDSRPIDVPWPIVSGAAFAVAVDGLSALFLVPVFLISLLGSVYGLGYWKQSEHPENGRKLRLFYGLLTAGMALVVVARNGILFLAAWEVMALAAFFLVTTEDHQRPAREAGWIYLVATHTATLVLFALFALLHAASHSFALVPLKDGAATPGMLTAIFVCALVGFGVKAGIMPLHVWLPSAHAIAPSHVSALMSGVIIKMGVYGLFRVTSLLPNPPLAWGGTLLGLGVVSGILGVAFAIGQHDLKRLLAYHSIENIGIIIMGLGLALLGRSVGRADLVVLGAAGGLLHVWNHALFKALLFLGAGSVIHATHTREIDHLGGLSRRMPYTAFCFLVGAVAICGLPPLNGFVSEFLVYLGLFGSLTRDKGSAAAGAALAAPALALIGALAVACFVKVYGAVFLGTARSPHADDAHESGPSMIAPMGVLVACCLVIGLAPGWVAPLLAQGVSAWDRSLDNAGAELAAAPLGWVSLMGLVLLAGLLLGGGLLWCCLRRSDVARGATWGCGYVAPTARMQYTSSSFAQMLVGLFARVLLPRTRRPAVVGLFPQGTAFHSDVPDTVLDRAVLPAFRSGAWLFSWFRVFQQGSIQTYILYIFLALIALLLWRGP
ncbi:MAG TPA: proton-conducting transporter membrane subunit [Gemmataceae bacterium]|nr:proton-conducting transporter membrane subunit [Gemmataceae bacterium]